ncbi:hypothetical protein TanjilG_31857 [Lupinus angustifolius]|uniref:Uncharacterized protein n=1 Tax=Lupinus angustifolius TaxID=3871 RepID=A0A394D8S9_LUPAN|nr:PREDICTED: transcription factor MYB44-like [Lupinus angustifolius]OIW19980.1 hypothetical protein TanjilG_31857 [Lupinus angustifolius]
MEVLGCNTSSGSESKKSCSRGHWKPEEDEKLKQLVMQYGPQNWNFISENIEGRSGKSCRLRWYNQLSPNMIKKPFSDEEEEMLLTLHKLKGNKWATIAKFFPGRTDNAVKNHFHVLLARRKRARLALFGNTLSHNSRTENFNIGMFDMPLISASSTITSSFDSSGVSSTAGEKYPFGSSSILSSYQSFTAPGIPSVGKVVPLQIKFSNSSYNHRIENLIKSSNTSKQARDNSMAMCKLSMNIHEQEQHEGINIKQKSVAFIDFLGVGSSSGHDESIIRP